MTTHTFDYDYMVIGGGSGGVRSARVAASHGAKVLLVEGRDDMGGTCVHRGCIPKKLLGYAASFGHSLHEAAGMGWQVNDPQHDWVNLRQNVQGELSRLNNVYNKLLADSGVTTVKGWAKFIDAHTVQIGAEKVTAQHILIATGGTPKRPDIAGAELALLSDDIFTLPEMPASMAVLGGGYIGLEMATILAGLGCQVTLIHRDTLPLRGFDHDIRKAVLQSLDHTPNLSVKMSHKVTGLVATDDGGRIVQTDRGDIAVDAVLAATGRVPNSSQLRLDKAGVRADAAGHITVNARFETSVPHIYAVGDVSSRYQLTPIAIIEGHFVADLLFGNQRTAPELHDHDITTAVFCAPPVAVIGYSEDKAIESGMQVDVYESAFRPLKSRITGSMQQTYMKLIVNRADNKVIGLHMLGTDTPEILQGFAAAIKAGITKAQLDSTVALHPTAAEELVLMRRPRNS